MSLLEQCSVSEPLGVYIHFPFCRSKCGYCDFASSAVAEIPHLQYAEAVLEELAGRAGAFAGRELKSIYLGGGTPSLWDPRQVARIIQGICRAFNWTTEPEITLEVNPGTVDQGTLIALRGAGVNRLSIGIQSLDDTTLRLLTRTHDARDAIQATRQARSAGFDNLSCDLICGIPGQTIAHHRRQLQGLLDLRPDHISLYGLTLSARCALRRAGYLPVSDDLMAEMLEEGREMLAQAGVLQYEVSNFARNSRRSMHNMLIWQGGAYLGLGASAHSMLYAGAETYRSANPALTKYLRAKVQLTHPLPAPAGALEERISGASARHEVMFLGLRTADGVDRAFFRRRFGEDPLDHYEMALEQLVSGGLVSISRERIRPTPKGLWFADELALRLMT